DQRGGGRGAAGVVAKDPEGVAVAVISAPRRCGLARGTERDVRLRGGGAGEGGSRRQRGAQGPAKDVEALHLHAPLWRGLVARAPREAEGTVRVDGHRRLHRRERAASEGLLASEGIATRRVALRFDG